MRIVAGMYSSRTIITPRGNDTRPTLDKVREAVFSSLGGMFDGGSVLDLYAGSGAIGLEALSRGMDHAVFADPSREAVRCIKENIRSLHVNDRCTVYPMKDMAVLKKLAEENMRFDLIYLDPPYKHAHHDEVLSFLDEHHMIKEGGRVVIESLKEEMYDRDYPGLHPYKNKVYGISRITYYRAD